MLASEIEGDWTIHLKTSSLTPFYLEPGYCHGRARPRVSSYGQGSGLCLGSSYCWGKDEVKKSREVEFHMTYPRNLSNSSL